jgi:hypothetical protein
MALVQEHPRRRLGKIEEVDHPNGRSTAYGTSRYGVPDRNAGTRFCT